MPIYHKSTLRPRRDIYANAEERLVLRQAPSQMSVEFEEHKHLRTAAPTDLPLRRTLMWAASLPPEVRPIVLMRHFARIANLIALTWGDPRFFHAYMESLSTDKRGNRRGFPPDVLAELGALQRYRDTL